MADFAVGTNAKKSKQATLLISSYAWNTYFH